MNLNGKINKSRICVIVMIVLTIYRVCLFLMIPHMAVGGSGYDDQYMIRLAEYIGKGWWLGDYDYTTLIKSVSYPIFIALSNFLCIPYSLSLGAFFVLAAFLFYLAIRNITENSIVLTASYLFILYSPVGFSDCISQELYRNAIVFPAAVVVISCILLAYFARNKARKEFFFWLFMLGIAFSFFYYIREDSIWLVPLVAGAMLLSAVWLIWFSQYDKKETGIRCCFLLMPLILFLVVTLAYKSLNYYKYDVFMTNDRTTGSFADFTGNIVRLKDDETDNHEIWISRSKLEKVCNTLPSMKDNPEAYLSCYDDWANRIGAEVDIPGDTPFWVVREAINALGFCKDAPTFQNYCAQLNTELLQAVEDGKFEFDDDALYFSKQSGGICLEDIPDLLLKAIKLIVDDSLYKDAVASCDENRGNLVDLRYMESVTSTNMVHPSEDRSVIYGWVVLKDDIAKGTEIMVIDGENKYFAQVSCDSDSTIQKQLGCASEQFQSFNCTWDKCTDMEQVKIQCWNDGKRIYEGNLVDAEDDNIRVHIEFVSSGVVPDDYKEFHTRVRDLSNLIIGIYAITAVFMLVVTVISLFVFLGIWIYRKTYDSLEPFILLMGLLLTGFVASFGVTAFICDWVDQASWYYSASSVLAAMQCFEVTAFCYIWKLCRRKIAAQSPALVNAESR